MRHEVVRIDEDLPDGYESYSLLLVPDQEWLGRVPVLEVYSLFNRFKQFGQAIGPRHLAAWFYAATMHGFGKHLDVAVFSAIHNLVSSPKELEEQVVARSGLPPNRNLDGTAGGYDILRAKQLCAALDLSFNKGPYVAFFTQKPDLPSGHHQWLTPGPRRRFRPRVRPSFLLCLGGLRFHDALSILNTLEKQLLSAEPQIMEPTLQQIGLRLAHIIRQLPARFSGVIEVIKSSKELLLG